MTQVHPNDIRGPIEDDYSQRAAGYREDYLAEREVLDKAYEDDLKSNEVDRAAALRAAGFGPDGATSLTFPKGSAEPKSVTRPSITGTPDVGNTLTIDPGLWERADSVAYQWQRANSDGSNIVDIAGQTGATYDPVIGDVGKKILVKATATNDVGSTTVQSDLTAAVTNVG